MIPDRYKNIIVGSETAYTVLNKLLVESKKKKPNKANMKKWRTQLRDAGILNLPFSLNRKKNEQAN